MRFVTMILLCLSLPFFAYSQEEESKNEIGFFVYGGLQMPQLNEMNTFLENSGYSKLPDNHFSGGFAIYKETGKILIPLNCLATTVKNQCQVILYR